jgi:hypothetical protein
MQFETQQLADLRPARLVTVSETSDTRPPCFLALDFLGSTGHGTVLTCSCTIALETTLDHPSQAVARWHS